MKLSRLIIMSLTGLLLAGCVAEMETVTAVPTRIPVTNTPVVVVGTAVLPTSASTSTHTATFAPLPTHTPTLPPSATPTVTPTPLPPLPGEIYFLWDPKHLPRGEVFDPIQNLYLISDEGDDGLEISLVVNEIVGWPYISLSPDKTTFVFTGLEDRNGDGYVSFEGFNRGFDGPNVFSYSREDSSVSRVTSDYPIIFNPEWEADGQRILYGQSTYGLSSINVADGASHLIASFPGDQITWTDVSPDGRLVALNLDSILINIINIQTGEITQVTNEIGGFGVERVWSPDSKWLVLSQPVTNRVFLVNVETSTANLVSEVDAFYSLAWSPDSQRLAFVQDTTEGSRLMSLNPIDLSTEEIVSTPGKIYSLQWSPDGSQLAMAIAVEETATLDVLNIESGKLRELWQSDESRRFHIPAWSPDGEWLLFFHGRGWPLSHGPDDEAGLYHIHQNGGEAQLILDTSNTSDPYGFFWLPEIQNP